MLEIKKGGCYIVIDVLKRLSYFFIREKKGYITMAVVLIFISVLALLPATIIGRLIDLISTQTATTQNFTYLLGALLVISFARYGCSWIYHMLANQRGQKLSFELREQYLMKLFDMDAVFF